MPPDMERVWDKLREHDDRFGKIEARLEKIGDQIGQLHLWMAGTAVATFLAMAGLMVGLWSYSATSNQTALAAIQTILAARPPEPSSPQQPTIIVVPTPAQPGAPAPAPQEQPKGGGGGGKLQKELMAPVTPP
ncbi:MULTISPECIES: hypothetical protein [unclassified Methylobacterium]|uniref:hypothetical protein n=1 Tax=unclassified Methylobacterium TaxID=2615210 RepID=UPI00226A146B|nr:MULTISPECIES: hypothetical protein [unclassified Methylobacterium]